VLSGKLSRAQISRPRVETFFRLLCDARIRDHLNMMIGGDKAVNGGNSRNAYRLQKEPRQQKQASKKSRARKSPASRYWPREADTITFQEGLLNSRATGGGGQMRNANAQRLIIMVRVGVLRQPFTPHVRHAETGGFCHQSEVGKRIVVPRAKSGEIQFPAPVE
jgi:hypothetical protein